MYLLNLLALSEQFTTGMLTVLFIVGIGGVFIWMNVSGRKKQKAAQDMVEQLKIGDRVKTIGGICGFVVQINDAENTFVLETGLEENKSYVKFDKGAIYQTAPAQGSAVANEEKPQPKADEKQTQKTATKSATAKKSSKKAEAAKKATK